MSQLAHLLSLLPSLSEGGISLQSAKLKAFRRWFFFDEAFLKQELGMVRFIRLPHPTLEAAVLFMLQLFNIPTGYHPKASYPSFPPVFKMLLYLIGLSHQHLLFVPYYGSPTTYRSGLRQAVFHAWAHHLWEDDTLGYETDASLFYHRQLKSQVPLQSHDLHHMDLRHMHALRDYIQSDAEALMLLSLML